MERPRVTDAGGQSRPERRFLLDEVGDRSHPLGESARTTGGKGVGPFEGLLGRDQSAVGVVDSSRSYHHEKFSSPCVGARIVPLDRPFGRTVDDPVWDMAASVRTLTGALLMVRPRGSVPGWGAECERSRPAVRQEHGRSTRGFAAGGTGRARTATPVCEGDIELVFPEPPPDEQPATALWPPGSAGPWVGVDPGTAHEHYLSPMVPKPARRVHLWPPEPTHRFFGPWAPVPPGRGAILGNQADICSGLRGPDG